MSVNLKVGFVFLCAAPIITGCICMPALLEFSFVNLWLGSVCAFAVIRGAVLSIAAIFHGEPLGKLKYGALLALLGLGIGVNVLTWQSYHDAQEAARIEKELSAREASSVLLKQGVNVDENASAAQDSGTN